MSAGLLANYCVLELASVLAGPSVGQFFAEHGATVWKVENPRTNGDVTRRWRVPREAPSDPPESHDDRSAYFCACNHGKQSIALNLSDADGQALLHDLVRRVDVVLASFRPGTARILGADYETLSSIRPSLLYGHITGYGPDHPRAGYDAVVQAETGFMHMNGAADGPPTKLPVALMDVLAAHQLKEGLLLALLRRERTGEGAYVPVSLEHAAVSALANQATNWLVGRHAPQRMGSGHPNIMPYGTAYATAEGTPVVLAVGTDAQFDALCDVLGLNALSRDARFSTNAARVNHRETLHSLLADAIAAVSAPSLMEALHERNVPAGIVRGIPAVFEHPGPKEMILSPDEGPSGLQQTATPAFAPVEDLLPPPRYAAHTDVVLHDQLGVSGRRLQALEDAGTIARRASFYSF